MDKGCLAGNKSCLGLNKAALGGNKGCWQLGSCGDEEGLFGRE